MVIFNQMQPNAMGILDTVLFCVEAAYSVWFLIVFGQEGNECKETTMILYVSMILCIVNACVKFLQALIYFVMLVISIVFLVSKMMTLKEVGDVFGFLAVFLGSGDDEEGEENKEEERKLADDQ